MWGLSPPGAGPHPFCIALGRRPTTNFANVGRVGMSDGLYRRILTKAQEFDASARISKVSRRDTDDGVLVRLTAEEGQAAGLAQALRRYLPLASVSTVENRLSGRTEAQVLLPDEAEQAQLAKSLAMHGAWQHPLRLAANLLIAALGAVCVYQAIEITRD